MAPLCASATITVTFFSGSDNLPQTVAAGQIELANKENLSPGYYAIDNLAHIDSGFGGLSDIGFMRFRYGDELCGYFYRGTNRGTEDPIYSGYESIETWGTVYWAGYGDGTLVDGAPWGSDNYILMRDASNTMVAVLQFNFDETTHTASLIATAVDFGGLTFTQGVEAIAAGAIPEASTYAAMLGAVALGGVLIARRRKAAKLLS